MNYITLFFVEFGWVILFLFLFGFVGGFVVLPFRHRITYPLLTTPLCGILITALGVAGFYVIGLSLALAATITLIGGSLITLLAVGITKPNIFQQPYFLYFFVFLWIAALTWLVNHTSIAMGHRAFLFMDGTDQLGYSQLADWLMTHNVHQRPILSALHPYQSWPYYMFQGDPRFGCIYVLAVIAWLQHYSGMFSYDSASSIILISGILAVSAVFAKDKKTLILALIGLTICQWFALGRSGYFGKIFAFPAIFFLLGLYFRSLKNVTPIIITLLSVLTCAIAMGYPGTVTAFLCAVVIGFYCLAELSFSKNVNAIKDAFFVCILMVMIAAATTGILSLPNAVGFAAEKVHWFILWQQLFEIIISTKSSLLGAIAFYITVFLTTIIFCMAILKRNAIAVSLIASIIVLCVVLQLFQASWIAFQFIGILYPATLLGTIWLLNESHQERKLFAVVLLSLLLFSMAIRVSKFLTSIHHYTGTGVQTHLQFSSTEMKMLAEKIGDQSVLVNIADKMYALPILVEFGQRHMRLEWTPAAWNAIVGYRTWQPPVAKPAQLQLILWRDAIPKNCELVYRTNQYQLMSCAK